MTLPEVRPPAPGPRAAALPVLARYGLALALTALATVVAIAVDRRLAVPNLSLVFVPPVVAAAVSFGFGPALAAAAAGVLACNFFLIAPRHTLRVADPANVWALGLLLLTAALVSAVAAQSRRRTLEALRAADQVQALQALARTLAGAAGREAIAAAAAEALARLFKAPAAVLLQHDEELRVAALAGGAVLSAADEEAARWSLVSTLPCRGGAYPAGEADYDFWPVPSRLRQGAVIGVRLGSPEGRPPAPERLVEIVAGYLSEALDRERFAALAVRSRVEAASQQLKSDLLAAVSHDLKTPLSTVILTLQSLRRLEHDAPARAQLLALAEAEAARLNGLVGNLLDMNRLDAGAVAVRQAEVEPAKLVAAALRRTGGALTGKRVVRPSAAGPPLRVDPGLFEAALGHVLENAGKYAPEGSRVTIRCGHDQDEGWVEVLDEGPGFPEPIAPLLERFTRGVEGDGRPPGTGLGLAIARGFLEAQGGRLEARNRPGGGALVRLLAPLATPDRRAA